MAGTIDAKLRITADLAQAISALQGLAAKLGQVDAAAAAAGASVAVPTAEAGAAAQQATAAVSAEAKAYGELSRQVSMLAQRMLALQAAEKTRNESSAPAAAPGTSVPGTTPRSPLADPKKIAKDADEAAKALRLARFQSQQLQMQMTDIVVGLSTGQSPFYVLLQQGGQLRDLYGGIGGAMRAIASQFTAARIAVGGVLATIAATVAAVADGVLQQDAWNKSIARTGGIAGVTAGQMSQMARNIADQQNAAIGGVRETLAMLADTGTFSGDTINAAGRAVTALRKVSKESAADMVADFATLSEGVAAWALKHNKAYNVLTAAEFEHIQSLENEGRSQEAMRELLDKLADRVEQRAEPAIGRLERVWRGVTNWASRAWDAMAGNGRDAEVEGAVAFARERLERLLQARERRREAGVGEQEIARLDTLVARAQAQLAQLEGKERTAQQQAADQAEELRRQQEEAKKKSKEHQDALAQIDAAGAEERLARRLAALDREQLGVDQAHARGLVSEAAYAAALAQIELKRLQAQEAALQQRLRIERSRQVKKDSPEALAAQARIKGIETQLVEARARITAAAAKGAADADRFALDDARASASEWSRVWQDAYNRVRDLARANEAARAAAIADPVQRAKAEADAAVSELRQQIQDAQRDLQLRISLTPDEAMRAELQRQLDALTSESEAAIGEKLRRTSLDSFAAQYAETMQALRVAIDEINELEESGAITSMEAERRKNAERAKALPLLDELIKRQRALATTSGERNDVAGKAVETQQITRTVDEVNARLRAAASGGVGSFLTDVATKSKTALEAFQDFAGGIARSALDLVGKRFGEQIADSLFPRSTGGGSGGGGFLQAIGSFFASMLHTGGLVGAPGASGRMVPAAAWALAPRYHGGGIVGLKPRERAIVALDDEEVLTEDNPRHIKNFRRNFGGAQVGISVTVNGARGTDAQQSAAGTDLANSLAADLAPFVDERIERWTTRESRAGGVLDPRRRS